MVRKKIFFAGALATFGLGIMMAVSEGNDARQSFASPEQTNQGNPGKHTVSVVAWPAPAAAPSQASTIGYAENSKSPIDIARSALSSKDPIFVRQQQEIVGNCASLSRKQHRLMANASGVFDQLEQPKSEADKPLIIAAINKILAECKELMPLGIVVLSELNTDLIAHGKSLDSPLFKEIKDQNEHREVGVSLLNSGAPALIEAGSYELLRGINSEPQNATEKRTVELWDRGLLIAGCKLGGYCDIQSIQSQRLCLHSHICNVSFEDYWLSQLSADEILEVKKRTEILLKWLSSSESNSTSTLKSYGDIAKIVPIEK